jgi:RNA polymerase sigma-70 factor (ECF subfamily)
MQRQGSPIDQALQDGRATWPDVRIERELLEEHVRRVGISDDALRSRGSDIYLAAACTAGISNAIRAFDRTYLPQVDKYVQRLVLPADLIEETRQALRIRMLVGPRPRIGLYNGTAPIGGWLRVAAVRIALDLLESRGAGPPVTQVDDLGSRLAGSSTPADLDFVKGEYLPKFQEALDQALTSLSPREKTLLRFHFVDGLSVAAIAPLYKVHRATVARWLIEIRQKVFDNLRQRLDLEVPASASEFRSLLEAVRPDLGASLTRLLKSGS